MGYFSGLEPYTRCWSRSRLVVPLSMIVDSTLISCLSWRPPLHPSIESSNSLSEIFPPRISCHASCFSESVPSVSQSRFTIQRGKSLYFRLEDKRYPLSKWRVCYSDSGGWWPLRELRGSASQAVRVLGRFPFACPPHSPLVGRVVNLECARLLFRRVLDNLAVFGLHF
ncbi:hypothetical protein GQ457_15G017810 [Hibiscus cannabinus]